MDPLPEEEKAPTKAHDAGLNQEKGKHLKVVSVSRGKTKVNILLQLLEI